MTRPYHFKSPEKQAKRRLMSSQIAAKVDQMNPELRKKRSIAGIKGNEVKKQMKLTIQEHKNEYKV